MKKPDIPHDENARLSSLRSLGVLDTESEERFDRVTRMAKRIFDIPIALVSLVDRERQWFKSKVGIDASETSRDISFCGHAILSKNILVVPDTLKDKRFFDNPLVTGEPFIRFYAGCPLKSFDGQQLGTLCLIDRKPRLMHSEELETLSDLAAMVERELVTVQLALLDELTGITNRRGFLLLAAHTLKYFARQSLPISLVFIDLSKFKKINDTFGHAEGDRAIILFSETMKRVFRDSDLFARLGGDEFVALLSNADKTLSECIIARLKQALDQLNLESNSGYDISFSYGAVQYDSDKHSTIEDLLAKGDEDMYRHKKRR